MHSQPRDSRSSAHHLAETIDLNPPSSAEAREIPSTESEFGSPLVNTSGVPEEAESHVAVIRWDSPDRATELRTLLRLRLRAATLLLLFGFLLFFIRDVVFGLKSPLHGFQVGLILLLAACTALLSKPRSLTTPRLRIIEAVIFGAVLLFFAAIQYVQTTMIIRTGDLELRALQGIDGPPNMTRLTILTEQAGSLVATLKNTIVFVFMLMVLYGLLIPNPWQRAALAVGGIVLVSGVVQAAVLWQTTGQRLFIAAVASAEGVSTNVLLVVLGAVLSIYGSHVINSLRAEAFEAKQLGQYQIRERLGGGGMGEVFLAEHKLLKRPCAIKLIHPDRAGDPTALKRFEREVRHTARLSHWNTIEIYDYGRTQDGTFYYVMEYLRGLSLADLVARHGPLPPGRIVYLLRQACAALGEAHAAGLIHRDLKPANIFAAQRGGQYDVTKLLDFGLVQPILDHPEADPSSEGSITGSPLYMSPEQATGGPLGPTSDIYGLGAVAYHLITGQPPFQGQNAVTVLNAVARKPVFPPSQLSDNVPEDLEHIILRCVAKNPRDRYPTTSDLELAFASCACAGDWDAGKAARWWREVASKAES